MERPIDVFDGSDINPDAIMTIETYDRPLNVTTLVRKIASGSSNFQIVPNDFTFDTNDEYGNLLTA
jgi:hypothetical protein